ncbi:MAG: glycosyltransferase family 39 protein, partial [Gammaproteobacteria bacterium]|nr:glycosyltransferase family 39 protein [Gammaproteobacteria bacterium]
MRSARTCNLKRTAVIGVLVSACVFSALFFGNDELQGDEIRYVLYANNLLQGIYAIPEVLHIRNGPGYPLLLAPFEALNSQIIIERIANSILVLLGLLYFYKLVRIYTSSNTALIATFCLGIYPPLLYWLGRLYSEAFAFFLINGFAYHFCSWYSNKNIKTNHYILAALYLGLLTLTKVLFGYVLAFSIFVTLIASLLRQHNVFYLNWKICSVFVLALCLCIPYLIYTHSVSSKFFYWGTQGSENLYWLTSPHPEEWGNSIPMKQIYERVELNHHMEFFNKLASLNAIERDNLFKKKVLEN